MRKSILLIILIVSFSCNQKVETFGEVISVTQFENETQSEEIQLIDVRTAEEFEEGAIGHALNMDVNEVEEFKNQIEELDKSKPIYLYCRSGNRSQKAAKILQDEGFDEIYDLQGGYKAWTEE